MSEEWTAERFEQYASRAESRSCDSRDVGLTHFLLEVAEGLKIAAAKDARIAELEAERDRARKLLSDKYDQARKDVIFLEHKALLERCREDVRVEMAPEITNLKGLLREARAFLWTPSHEISEGTKADLNDRIVSALKTVTDKGDAE